MGFCPLIEAILERSGVLCYILGRFVKAIGLSSLSLQASAPLSFRVIVGKVETNQLPLIVDPCFVF